MIPEPHATRDDERPDEFASSLAHSLNNLLQVVNGNLELLSTRVQDEQLRGYIRNAQLAAQQICQLAQDLNERSARRD
jgi:signal transduction histidine kinase